MNYNIAMSDNVWQNKKNIIIILIFLYILLFCLGKKFSLTS